MNTMIRNPVQVLELIISEGQKKANRPILQFFSLAILGGAYVAIGSLLALVVGGGVPGLESEYPGIQKLLFGAVFPLGLILVVVTGADLFTSDCAVLTISTAAKKTPVKKAIVLLVISYLGNFIGALVVIMVLAFPSGFLSQDPWRDSLVAIAEAKTNHSFFVTMLKGIGANWLVCLAAWQGYAAKDALGKIAGIWFPVMAFVTLGLEHSIANMFFIPAAIIAGGPITGTDLFINNLMPATIGNLIGGVVFLGLPQFKLFYQPIRHDELEEHT